MKTKLLKKCRRKVKFYERNGKYYVYTENYLNSWGKSKENALAYYRFWILQTARSIFNFKPKHQFFKY